MTSEQIGKEIRFNRERGGLTLRKCAGILGISPTWLSGIENGKAQFHRPSPELAARLLFLIKVPRQTRTQIIEEWRKPEVEALAKWDELMGVEG